MCILFTRSVTCFQKEHSACLENYDLHLVAASLHIHTTKHPHEKQLQVCPRRAFKIIRLLYLVAAYLRIQTLNNLPSKYSYLESDRTTKVCCVGYMVDI